ncbi:MAG: hypothetical protein KDI48_18935 [Xanthomonadales bacterium]|nr:hypothetical protein [Xanthomonadales bacterium]
MSKPSAILALILTLLGLPAVCSESAPAADAHALLERFVTAFNAGDFDTMAAFYADAATAAFNQRRDAQEQRALHTRLTGMLGKLTLKKIETVSSDQVRLLADATVPGKLAELRFTLLGDPPRIETFRVGIPPGPDTASPEADASEATHAAEMPAADAGPFAFLTAAQGIHQSQLLVQADHSLLLVWVQKGSDGTGLYAAREQDDGSFSAPLQINRAPLNPYVGDEARPSVAVAPDGSIAVAWTAATGDIMLAVGSDYGRRFEPPVKLNQDDKQAQRTMPSVAISPDGVAHAVWLDARTAPEGMEEPSNLYLASVSAGVVEERNLTANQETTVCGCCRPFIAFDDGGHCDIAFRNVSEAGYRDISRISGTIGALSEPQPTSPPIWKLGGCPSAGPIIAEGGTLWKDASTGDWRLLWATDAERDPLALFSDRTNLAFTTPPRSVSGKDEWVLVGANPNGLIATFDDGAWQIVRDDLPPWATSAAARDGQLILLGNRKGQLLTARLAL